KRTLGWIEERYYWPHLRQQVLNYVQACPQCQARKNPPVKPQGHMEIIRVERPFEKVGMDILGPFPVSVGGKKNIIVAVDYLTNWAETRAVPTATARDAAEFFCRGDCLTAWGAGGCGYGLWKMFRRGVHEGSHASNGGGP
ncbi:Uncharacterized protein APZ42_008258, partial [Daphnia magna]